MADMTDIATATDAIDNAATPIAERSLDEHAAGGAARSHRGMAIAAGILFFSGAVLAGWPLRKGWFVGLITFCGRRNGPLYYPWGWSGAFSYSCSPRDFTIAFSIVTIAALIGCGAVSMTVGQKNARLATFIIGIILSCVTLISTVVAIKGIIGSGYFIDARYLQRYCILLFLLFLVIPVLLMPLAKSSSGETVQLLTAFMIVAMAMVFTGIWYAPTSFTYLLHIYIYAESFIIFAVNLGNLPLFAAVILLAFAVPLPPSRGRVMKRNTMLVSGSAMAIAGGAIVLLYLAATGQMVPFIHNWPFIGLFLIVASVYMIIVGIIGLASLATRSRSGLLVGLGIGLIAVQVRWLLTGYGYSRLFAFALFGAMAIVYLVGAIKLRKDPAAPVITQSADQPYAGQPHMGQPYMR